MAAHHLPHGQDLLSDPQAFLLFLDAASSLDDFCELCQEWETQKGAIHTKEEIQNFEREFTPGLIPAVKEGSSRIPLLLHHGANPFEYDKQGFLPFHWAAGTGNLIGVQALFYAEEGAKDNDSFIVDIMDNSREPKEGATPFHWACCGVSTEFEGEGGAFSFDFHVALFPTLTIAVFFLSSKALLRFVDGC